MSPLRFTALLCALTAAGCGGPSGSPGPVPTAPAPLFSGSLTGIWSGFARTTACVYERGACSTGAFRSFVLRITTNGAAYVAAIEFQTDVSYAIDVDLTGTLQPDGSVMFSGQRPVAALDAAVTVSGMRVRADAAAGLAGEFTIREQQRTSFSEVSYTILSASQKPFGAESALGFSGSWRGYSRLVSCSGNCGSWRTDDSASPIELMLTQNGGVLSGQIVTILSPANPLSLSGSVSGLQLSFTAPSRRFETERGEITAFAGSLNGLGRIQGAFSFSGDTRAPLPGPNVTIWSYQGSAEILWLTRTWR